ncbi:MAG TPA: alpha/beta hydrolase [Thermoleophilaceae bacterium]|nr:alpha/beta hydrolase [Thermoleophilaceae bacterium]
MLTIEDTGSGENLLLLHGLTATRRYVLQGSRLLAREGCRLVSYDARAHGESDPAEEPGAYEYSDLARDAVAVIEERGLSSAVLIGHSMGAATAVRVALERPELVKALVQITPAYAGEPYLEDSALAYWDRLAAGLESDGVDGFMRAFEAPGDPRWREAVLKFTRQRIERHRHPEALAQAVRVVPRSEAFDGLDALAQIDVPVLVIGSRDDADPNHPLAVAEEYARRLPRVTFVVEDEGDPPLAWQGAQLSRAILDWLRRQA